MKKIGNIVLKSPQRLIVIISSLSALFILMLYRLKSITSGLSQQEVDIYYSSFTLKAITENMVNAPYKAAIYAMSKILDPELGIRLVGALIAIIAVILFYLLVSQLFNFSISFFTTVLFASSSLMLAISRLANPTIMLLLPLSMIAVGALIYSKDIKNKDILWTIAIFLTTVSIYTPGLLLIVVTIILWKQKFITKELRTMDHGLKIINSAMFGVLIIPFLYSVLNNPSIVISYMGLSSFIESPTLLVHTFLSIPTAIFLNLNIEGSYWLHNQPILDVFSSILLIIGLCTYLFKWRLARSKILITVLVSLLAWVCLTSITENIFILLPVVYVLIGTGIDFIHKKWVKIFPKNPIAHTIGILFILLNVFLVMNFQIRRSLLAWPNTNETREVYSRHIYQ